MALSLLCNTCNTGGHPLEGGLKESCAHMVHSTSLAPSPSPPHHWNWQAPTMQGAERVSEVRKVYILARLVDEKRDAGVIDDDEGAKSVAFFLSPFCGAPGTPHNFPWCIWWKWKIRPRGSSKFQHGSLSRLAWWEGGGKLICTVMDGLYRQLWRTVQPALHRKKRFTSFPSPAGMSLTKPPLGRKNSVMTSLFPPRESLVVTSRLGTGNSRTFFYGVARSW